MTGAALANAMFDLPVLQLSSKVRAGAGQWLGEVVATTGLLLVTGRCPSARVSALVAAYIGAAYWTLIEPAVINDRLLPQQSLPYGTRAPAVSLERVYKTEAWSGACLAAGCSCAANVRSSPRCRH